MRTALRGPRCFQRRRPPATEGKDLSGREKKTPASEGGRYKDKRNPRGPGEPGPYKTRENAEAIEIQEHGQERLCHRRAHAEALCYIDDASTCGTRGQRLPVRHKG
jgi:hypothetical protein